MQNRKLVYVFDPYCGWCYGNSRNLHEIFARYHEKVEFKIYPAGMWSGEHKRKLTPDLAQFIEHAAIRVSDVTEVLFSTRFYDLLSHPNLEFDSEIPSRAMVTIESYWNRLNVDYSILLQRAFFWEGKLLSEDGTYEYLADKMDLPVTEFMRLFHSDEMKEKTLRSFVHASSYSVSYPALFEVDCTGRVHLVSQGYEPLSMVSKRIENLIH